MDVFIENMEKDRREMFTKKEENLEKQIKLAYGETYSNHIKKR